MLRIRLATGEEAVYRTVEELALGISSGTVTAAALVYDSSSQDWRSIEDQAEYQEAVARAVSLSLTDELNRGPESAASASPRPSAGEVSGPLQIYQMFSRSAAELQARKRPAWLLPAATAAGGILMLASLVLVVVLGSDDRGAHIRLEPSHPAETTAGAAGSIRLPAATSVEAMRLAPVNLNSHMAWAMDAAGRRLADTVSQLGVRALLSPGRLRSSDSVRLTRDLLVSVRALVAGYRGAQRQIATVYRDTATTLVKSGFWSRVDEQEWRAYPPSMESPREAAQADSLLGMLEQLYDLLEDEAGHYRELDGRLQFDDVTTGLQYERLRAGLGRHEVVGDTTAIRPNRPLALLRRSLSGPAAPLPPPR